FDYDNASNSGNFWDIDSWDDGTTEPGSSGSPLFDGISHRIIGQLYGGVASCTNFGYDTYGKTSVSWNLGLNEYLDPNNLGVNYIDGIDAIDLPEPILSYSDINLLHELADGETSTSSFEFSNIGELESVLTYSLNINQFKNPQGGPDLSDNFWTDSNNEIGLDSDWIDISNIGTVYNFSTNDNAGESINIGFEFPFYENIYTECFINPNGWIGFENDDNNWDNTSLPSSQAPKSAIFGFWDDLNPVNDFCSSCSGEVYYHSNDERIVIWFNDVSHWPTYFDNSTYNFQMVLYKNGEIKFNYNLMNGDFSSATIGIQNSSGTSGLMMSFNANYAENNLTTIISKAPSWVGINNIGNYSVSGEINQGFSQSLSLLLQNNQLVDEIYNAYLNISSNGSENISLPIELITANNGLIGDINNDDNVNVSDIVLVVNLVLSSQYNYLADLNSDNQVNVSDIVLLVNLILQN
ncbi:dockerin type I repeat-containing protein, partial [Candidatus Marinimicrobia bacterium]|nr:dockerin type I repeat-containing protein [Candidatus Neomarinimicrobiota bacterium]